MNEYRAGLLLNVGFWLLLVLIPSLWAVLEEVGFAGMIAGLRELAVGAWIGNGW